MSTKTTFKRIALVAVAALGLGVLSVAPSSAAVTNETLTAVASATTINVGESVTVTVTNTWTSSSGSDSRTILVDTPNAVGGGAITSAFYLASMGDTINAVADCGATCLRTTLPVKYTSAAGPARSNSAKTTIDLYNFTAAGTYYVTVYSSAAGVAPSFQNAAADKSVALTITVVNPTFSGLRLYTSTDTTTGLNARVASKAAVDSSVVVSAGVTGSNNFAAIITGYGLNAAGETRTGQLDTGVNTCTVQTTGTCDVTVSITGGLISKNGGGTLVTSLAWSLNNSTTGNQSGDTITVYSNGTVGTATITFAKGATVLATKTMTFTGPAASATVAYGDTIIAGTTSGALKAWVKDANGGTFTGSVYLFSSDTSVISESATACSYSTSLGYHSCAITAAGIAGKETGTATVVVRNTSTLGAAATATAAATWTSSALSWTVRGAKIQSFTATFDKATYGPGEKAILTITAKDRAGNTMADGAISNAFDVVSSKALQADIAAPNTFTPHTYAEDGVETRVVYMPSTAGNFTYSMKFGTGSWTALSDLTATPAVDIAVIVTDPNAAATAAAKDASDAATDAALEATDAAYAATDAANIAAEAADAATAAAEAATEAANAAKESADAATAAVEELATSVAKLMAALQAQITTLAKVVAKIAVKVKA